MSDNDCRFCEANFDEGTHCQYCNACDWEKGDCKNAYCDEDLIDSPDWE